MSEQKNYKEGEKNRVMKEVQPSVNVVDRDEKGVMKVHTPGWSWYRGVHQGLCVHSVLSSKLKIWILIKVFLSNEV